MVFSSGQTEGEIVPSSAGCRCAYCLAGKDHAGLDTGSAITDPLILPGGGGAVTPENIGTNNALNLVHGFEWGPGGGTAVTVTYSFLTSVPSYYPSTADERFLFSSFTPEMKDATRTILQTISTFANVTFTEVAGVGDITFGQALLELPPTSLLAYAYYPDQGNVGGDVWLNNLFAFPSIMDPGEQGYYAVQHEIGHALGLIHSFDAGFTGDENTEQYSVMAYDVSPWGNTVFASGYMLYDIYALQSIYGANTSFNSGNTTYTLDPNAAYTVWDGGGFDTFNSSAISANVIIHLEEGGFSSVGLSEHIAIAYGTVIEATKTGSGHDHIYGNAADNTLEGGLGNDHYHYSSGDDTVTDTGGIEILHLPDVVVNENNVSFLRYSLSPDDLVIYLDDLDGNDQTSIGTITVSDQFEMSGAYRVETLEFHSGFSAALTNLRVTTFATQSADTIEGIMFGAHPDDTIYAFGGDDIVEAKDGNDIVYGGAGNDQLWGNDGGDALFGNQDDDIIYGGAGDDFLFGDEDDTAASESFFGNDIIFGEAGEDWIEGNKGADMISGGDDTDIIFGGSGNDLLSGDNGNDYLVGEEGDDILSGGAGVDELYGGTGKDTFIFDLISNAGDTIKDFAISEGDIINVSGILSAVFDALQDSISDFIFAADDGIKTVLSIDQSGSGNSLNASALVTLESVTGRSVDQLFSDGNIVL